MSYTTETPMGNTSSGQSDAAALKQKAGVAKDAVAELAAELKNYAGGRWGSLKDTTVDKVQDAGENIVDFIQRNPYKAIGIAAGIGFVAGLLLKRR